MPSIVQASAAQSTVSCATTVAVDTPNPVTIIIRDAAGNGIEGVPASQIVLAVSGSNNTLTQPTGVTNSLGYIEAAFESSTTGERTVSATVSGLAITATVTVDVGGSSADPLEENLPSGMTVASDNPWTGPLLEAPSGEWADLWIDPVTDTVWEVQPISRAAPTIVTDATAPESLGSCLALDYEGTADGFDPRGPLVTVDPANEFAIGMYVKFASTWVQPEFSGIKWNLMRDSTGIFGWWALGPEVQDEAGPPNVAWDYQFGACASGNCPVDRRVEADPKTGASLAVDTWHKVQYYIRKDPAVFRLWINDVLVIEKNDFTWASTSGIWRAELGGTWGGGIGYPAPAGNIVYYGRTLVLRRN